MDRIATSDIEHATPEQAASPVSPQTVTAHPAAISSPLGTARSAIRLEEELDSQAKTVTSEVDEISTAIGVLSALLEDRSCSESALLFQHLTNDIPDTSLHAQIVDSISSANDRRQALEQLSGLVQKRIETAQDMSRTHPHLEQHLQDLRHNSERQGSLLALNNEIVDQALEIGFTSGRLDSRGRSAVQLSRDLDNYSERKFSELAVLECDRERLRSHRSEAEAFGRTTRINVESAAVRVEKALSGILFSGIKPKFDECVQAIANLSKRECEVLSDVFLARSTTTHAAFQHSKLYPMVKRCFFHGTVQPLAERFEQAFKPKKTSPAGDPPTKNEVRYQQLTHLLKGDKIGATADELFMLSKAQLGTDWTKFDQAIANVPIDERPELCKRFDRVYGTFTEGGSLRAHLLDQRGFRQETRLALEAALDGDRILSTAAFIKTHATKPDSGEEIYARLEEAASNVTGHKTKVTREGRRLISRKIEVSELDQIEEVFRERFYNSYSAGPHYDLPKFIDALVPDLGIQKRILALLKRDPKTGERDRVAAEVMKVQTGIERGEGDLIFSPFLKRDADFEMQ